MGFEVIWTTLAEKGYDRIVDYLKEEWTDREIRNFLIETRKFIHLLQKNPQLLQPSTSRKNVFRGPMNRLTLVTYRVWPRKKVIEILNIRGTRQKPLKK
jgi:plasmid stabilization system protein ParE